MDIWITDPDLKMNESPLTPRILYHGMPVKMEFCPPNVTFGDGWANDISPCIVETVCNCVLIYFLVFGITNIIMLKSYGKLVKDITSSKQFEMQQLCTLLVPVLSVTRILFKAFVFEKPHVYGYMILTLVTTLIVFPLTAYQAHLERSRLLSSDVPKRHGLAFVVFLALLFVTENVSLACSIVVGWQVKNIGDIMDVILFVGRYGSCMVMIVLGVLSPGMKHPFHLLDNSDKGVKTENSSQEDDEHVVSYRKTFKMAAEFLIHIWPRKEWYLKACLVICGILEIGTRILNLYGPIYSKMIVDSLSTLEFRWDLVLIFACVKVLQGGSGFGVLDSLRSHYWKKVEQHTSQEIKLRLFNHLHSLPLQWHLSRKNGDVMRVMDRGSYALEGFLDYTLFTTIPTVFDVILAIVFFCTKMNFLFGLTMFFTMVLYVVVTITITERRSQVYRNMYKADDETQSQALDSLLNYETVKYFGAESYEANRYKQNIYKFQEQECTNDISLKVLSFVQDLVICMGLLITSLGCVYLVVVKKTLSVGDYVLFSTYLTQLYDPLNSFGWMYKSIQHSFVELEKMFEVMETQSVIRDIPNAIELVKPRGEIEFKDVSFGYSTDKPILKNLSFKVAAGSTTAMVGPSGAGKSTVMRLLFRFYDVNEGAVLVDGQDVRTVTQASLRANIGVVPQDTVLFHNTVRYNIQYGRLDADMADIIAAAKSADIHDKILTFTDAYDTQVGERGLKLSGGEKQRVAIARTILKDPSIVLLDEATSALDTNTERNIQAALDNVCANRTTIIIAHRLSTIIHADQILVIKNGEIVEKGNHNTLLKIDGVYASMWNQQLQNRKPNNVETIESTSTNTIVKDMINDTQDENNEIDSILTNTDIIKKPIKIEDREEELKTIPSEEVDVIINAEEQMEDIISPSSSIRKRQFQTK